MRSQSQTWFSDSTTVTIIQYSSVSQSCPTLQPHGLQYTRLLCPPLSPRVCSNSCALSQGCYLTISSYAVLFFFCLQAFPAPGSFPMIQLFASDGQSIRASASVLPMNIQDSFLLELTGLITLQSRGLSRVFSRTTIWKHQFLGSQPSLRSLTSVYDYWKNHSFDCTDLCQQNNVSAF